MRRNSRSIIHEFITSQLSDKIQQLIEIASIENSIDLRGENMLIHDILKNTTIKLF